MCVIEPDDEDLYADNPAWVYSHCGEVPETMDFTPPTTTGERRDGSTTAANELISIGSPRAVPVPCIWLAATALGERPASCNAATRRPCCARPAKHGGVACCAVIARHSWQSRHQPAEWNIGAEWNMRAQVSYAVPCARLTTSSLVDQSSINPQSHLITPQSRLMITR